MSKLHTEVCNAVNAIREALGKANVGQFHFTIEAEGRTETGSCSILIEYTVTDGRYGGNRVKGNSVRAVVTEMLRRHGWNEAHAPLMLTADEVTVAQNT